MLLLLLSRLLFGIEKYTYCRKSLFLVFGGKIRVGKHGLKKFVYGRYLFVFYNMSVARSSVQTTEPILDPHKGSNYYFETSSSK